MSECIFDRKKENLFCCQQKSKLSRAENCIQAKMYVWDIWLHKYLGERTTDI
jgi:hypothetical protein